jgi:hypothetical protein
MKLFMPSNIYSKILISFLEKNNQHEIILKDSSLLSKELENDREAVALIPSLDLINHRELFVSGKSGISFDGTLSNSYFYLTENEERTLGKILLRGDVSLNEIILTKILFEERFSSEVEIVLDTHKVPDGSQNTLVVGDENFSLWDYNSSISFSDQLAELLDFPYVNFIFVSSSREALAKLETTLLDIDTFFEENIDVILDGINTTEEIKLYVKENLGSVYFEMTSNEKEALNEMVKLVYYHGILDDIFEIKFI